jgi:thiol:disulfide interchange protein DsbD
MQLRPSVLGVSAAVLLAPLTARADLGERVAGALHQGSVLAYLLVFVGGVLTSLTPCVYPLIPITLSIFGARGESVTRRRAVSLATAYVGGIAAMYTSLGVVSALAGRGFGTQNSSAWFMVPVACVFLAMAASMFGAFELNLPQSVNARLAQLGGAGFGGAFLMGLVAGIIAAPCTGPVLAAVLAYVATQHSVLFGGSLLFVYAMGMGVLFFVLAASAASLPRSGGWMEGVKSVFGVVMIVAAAYFLRNVLSPLRHFGDWHTRFAWIHAAGRSASARSRTARSASSRGRSRIRRWSGRRASRRRSRSRARSTSRCCSTSRRSGACPASRWRRRCSRRTRCSAS